MGEKRGPKVKWTEKRVKALAKKIEAYAKAAFDHTPEIDKEIFRGPKFPTIAHCLKKNHVTSYVANELQHKHPILANAIKKIKDAQEHLLINYALRGGYQSTFAIFAAKNLIGWKDEKAPIVDQSRHDHYTIHQIAKEVNDTARSGADAERVGEESGEVFADVTRRKSLGQANGDHAGSNGLSESNGKIS